jgi:hypothetical protein
MISNPNVVFELGYAVRRLGFGRVVGTMNTAFGPPDDQMFDIKRRWPIRYDLSADASKGRLEKVQGSLSKETERALRTMLARGLFPAKGQATEKRFEAERQAFEEEVRKGKFWGMPRRPAALTVCVVPQGKYDLAFDAIEKATLGPLRPSNFYGGWSLSFGVDSVASIMGHESGASPTSVVEITTAGVIRAESTWAIGAERPTVEDWVAARPEQGGQAGGGRQYKKFTISASHLEDTLVTSLPCWLRSLRELAVEPPWREGNLASWHSARAATLVKTCLFCGELGRRSRGGSETFGPRGGSVGDRPQQRRPATTARPRWRLGRFHPGTTH